MEVKSHLDMVKYNSAVCGQCLQSENHSHHEQYIKIVGHLLAGVTKLPQKNTQESCLVDFAKAKRPRSRSPTIGHVLMCVGVQQHIKAAGSGFGLSIPQSQ
jgi:hypothetical protein